MATKQEILSKLAASHEQRISKVLFDLEEDIIAQLQRATDGVPLTTELAIQLRPNLKQLIEQNYLKEGSRIISEYDEVVKGYMDYIRTTPVSDKFKTLTKPDLKIINQLKQLSFSGFEDVANRFLDTIATEIYSSAVTGKPFPQVVENIRASINGVYRRSNEEAVNRLVRIVEENRYSDDPLAKKKYLDARKILHSKYASDIRGENMRKYANQIAHDSIMQFDGQFTKYKGQEAGINTYKYTGTNITTTRQFCRAYLNEIKTEEEWREVFTGNWRGKSGSDPFVNRGGYRCRHSLIPYDPAWDAIEDVQAKVQPKATDIKTSADAATNVSSLASPIKIDQIKQVSKTYIVNKLANEFVENNKDARFSRTQVRFSKQGARRLSDYGKMKMPTGFTNTDYGIMEAMFQELNDMAIKYGVPKIRGVKSTPLKTYNYQGRKIKAKAIANMGDGVIGLDPEQMAFKNIRNDLSTWKRFDDVSKRPEVGWDFYGDDKLAKIRHVYYHEFAHHIHHYKNIDIKDSYSLYFPDIEKKLNLLDTKLRGSSKYSDFNQKEWFAENFAFYHNGRTDLVDERWIEIFEEFIK